MFDTSLSPTPPPHASELKGLARSLLRDHAAVDDVLQQVWIASLNAPQPALRHDIRWLRGVTRNLVRNFVRDRSRRGVHERTASRDERIDDDPARHADRNAVQHILHAAVHELRSPYRETVRARYFEDVTVEQIAARTGRPPNTVKTHYAVHWLSFATVSSTESVRIELGVLRWSARSIGRRKISANTPCRVSL